MSVSRASPRELFASAALPVSGLFLLLAVAAPVIAAPNPSADLNPTEHAPMQVPVFQIAPASINDRVPGVDSSSAAVGTPYDKALPAPPDKGIPEQGLLDDSPGPLAETLPADEERASGQPDAAAEKWPVVQTLIPGISSVELQRFKRQMFRRDI